jgi:hypothetical protein
MWPNGSYVDVLAERTGRLDLNNNNGIVWMTSNIALAENTNKRMADNNI